MQATVLAVLVAFALGSGLGGWVAHRMAETRELEVALKYAEGWIEDLEHHRERAKQEQKRAVSAAEKRAATARRADELIHESTVSLDLSCEWRPDHRMRIESLYETYGFSSRDSSGVHD